MQSINNFHSSKNLNKSVYEISNLINVPEYRDLRKSSGYLLETEKVFSLIKSNYYLIHVKNDKKMVNYILEYDRSENEKLFFKHHDESGEMQVILDKNIVLHIDQIVRVSPIGTIK